MLTPLLLLLSSFHHFSRRLLIERLVVLALGDAQVRQRVASGVQRGLTGLPPTLAGQGLLADWKRVSHGEGSCPTRVEGPGSNEWARLPCVTAPPEAAENSAAPAASEVQYWAPWAASSTQR